MAKTFLARRERAVSACRFRLVRPGCLRLVPLPLPPALDEPRSTPTAASTSLINSGSRQSAERPRDSSKRLAPAAAPPPRPCPDAGPPGSPTRAAGPGGLLAALRGAPHRRRPRRCPHRPDWAPPDHLPRPLHPPAARGCTRRSGPSRGSGWTGLGLCWSRGDLAQVSATSASLAPTALLLLLLLLHGRQGQRRRLGGGAGTSPAAGRAVCSR